MRLSLLLLFGVASSVSISTLRQRQLQHTVIDSKVSAIGKQYWDKNPPIPSYSGYLEFGLRIIALPGVTITGPEFNVEDKKSGCGGEKRLCECTYSDQLEHPKTKQKMYSFTMKGDGWGYDLIFACKKVKFRVASTGQECKCDFDVHIDYSGYARDFVDKCEPQFCLNTFTFSGGGEWRTDTENFKQSYQDSTPKKKIYFAACNGDNKFCPSWGSFKAAFVNVRGLSSDQYAYGTQYQNGEAYTWGGYKWFFGFVVDSEANTGKEGKKKKFGPRLAGRWVPVTSGGQASFSQGMSWSNSKEKSTTEDVANALSMNMEASFGPVSVGVGFSHEWSSSATNTNSATSGGENSRTCAAYQCEGGTTWQWKMDLSTEKVKTTFQNCIFVCTTNQGNYPKCPFGACCSAENRLDECSTCQTKWCEPLDPECPMNPTHSEYKAYCGTTDKVFINFLTMLRSRVEVADQVESRQNEDFRLMQNKVAIKAKTQRVLQQAFRNFQYASATARGGKKCAPFQDTPAMIKHCSYCALGKQGCSGTPAGVAAGANKKEDWCKKNCRVAKAGTKNQIEKDELVEKVVQDELSSLGRELMTEKLDETRKYLEIALDQASDLDHEASVKTLAKDPKNDCAARKYAAPGSVIWCLCNNKGEKIESKSCKNGKFRGKQCEWKKDAKGTTGSCCSVQEGCPDAKIQGLNREYIKIREIDLSPEDFSWGQLVQANKRLRMECYYEVETKVEARNRVRKTKGLKQLTEKEKEQLEETSEQKKAEKIEERDNLFMCFRKFYFHHHTRLFTLQMIDQMLIDEAAPCEDRLINKNCVLQEHRRGDEDSVDLSGGGAGGEGGTSGGGGVAGAGGSGGLNGGDGEKVCCRKSGMKESKLLSEDNCSKDDGDKIMSMRTCVNLFGSKDGNKDGDEKKEGDKKESPTKDGNVQKADPGKDPRTQDPKQNEQKQEKKEEKKDGKVCCKAPDMRAILMGECREQYKKVDRGKCD